MGGSSAQEIQDFQTIMADEIRAFIRAYFAPMVAPKDRENTGAIDAEIIRATQSRWHACLMACGASLFGKRELYNDVDIENDIKPNGGFDYNNTLGTFNNSKLIAIKNIYIYLCSEYDKAIQIQGYCALTHIAEDTVSQWLGSSKRDTVTAERQRLIKTLDRAGEHSLENLLITGKRNPVAILGVVNHRYGWAQGAMSRDAVRGELLGGDALPSLGNMHKAQELPDKAQNAANPHG